MPAHENMRTPLDLENDPLVKEVEALLAAAGMTNPPGPHEIIANMAFSMMSPADLAAHFISLAAADGDPSGYQTFTKNHTFISAPSGFKRTGGHPVVDAEGNWVKREDPE